jgi:hypothetical protein
MSGLRADGRSDRIRTCGILLPKQARYQLRYTPALCSPGGGHLAHYNVRPPPWQGRIVIADTRRICYTKLYANYRRDNHGITRRNLGRRCAGNGVGGGRHLHSRLEGVVLTPAPLPPAAPRHPCPTLGGGLYFFRLMLGLLGPSRCQHKIQRHQADKQHQPAGQLGQLGHGQHIAQQKAGHHLGA